MATVSAPNWPRIIRNGIIPGLVGAIMAELCFYATIVLPQHGNVSQGFTFVASAALGKSAYANAAAPYIGAALTFCVAIGWAIGYAYIAQTRAGINRHYITSGIFFGLVVMIAMQIVLMAANSFHLWNVREFTLNVIGHVVFYGIPVSAVTRILERF